VQIEEVKPEKGTLEGKKKREGERGGRGCLMPCSLIFKS
jgi:hypothetical protein